jgi:hypothetical protein
VWIWKESTSFQNSHQNSIFGIKALEWLTISNGTKDSWLSSVSQMIFWAVDNANNKLNMFQNHGFSAEYKTMWLANNRLHMVSTQMNE